jgi:glutaconyl-CoA/methylmalonyl-CoA decarboxylase subunit gamma
MKKLRITVEGKTYDVTVQVLEDDERETDAGFLSPLPPAPRPAGPPRPAPAPAGPPIKGDPNAILAPLAGTVQKVFVQAGAHVDAKAPVVLLDAMKMDTYIYAPRGGEVAAVEVAPGDSVQVGDCLIRYRPGA